MLEKTINKYSIQQDTLIVFHVFPKNKLMLIVWVA
jgi:hypothetical protein